MHNPEINDGQSFFAAWDRRHQLQTVWGVKLSDRIQWNTTLVYATGEPNGIFREETRLFGENEAPKRLPDYTRLDTSIRYFATIGNVRMDAGFYIYNLLDKNNVQFRSLELVTNNGTVQGFSPAPVNFFDVGLQPSFNIRLSF